MNRNALFADIDSLVARAASILRNNYNLYYPKNGGGDPNERDLTTALACAVRELRPDWRFFMEVPVNRGYLGNKEAKIDQLYLAGPSEEGGPAFAILVESKNIHSPKQFAQISGDFAKMQSFVGKPLKFGLHFPERRLHLALMMDWRSEAALKQKLTAVQGASCPEDRPIIHEIRPSSDTGVEVQQLAALCRWAGPWNS